MIKFHLFTLEYNLYKDGNLVLVVMLVLLRKYLLRERDGGRGVRAEEKKWRESFRYHLRLAGIFCE